jgi:copper chaperone CopZ
MARSTLSVPSMYADHHVRRVRELLGDLEGVQDVQASAAFREVTVKHGKEVSKKDITAALEKAGYAVGKPGVAAEQEPSSLGDPSWYQCAPRSIKTEQADLEMSGDFRGY